MSGSLMREVNAACNRFFERRGMEIPRSWRDSQLKNYRDAITRKKTCPAAIDIRSVGITQRGAEWLDGWFYGTAPQSEAELGSALAWMAMEFPAGIVFLKEAA